MLAQAFAWFYRRDTSERVRIVDGRHSWPEDAAHTIDGAARPTRHAPKKSAAYDWTVRVRFDL